MMSLGTNDFLENYYSFPRSDRSSQFTITQYEDFLIGIARNFIRSLYDLGARKISLGGVPPMGCLPLERATNVMGGNDCNERYNTVALEFNDKLKQLTMELNKELSGIKLVFSNPYYIFMNIIKAPSLFGKRFKLVSHVLHLHVVVVVLLCMRMHVLDSSCHSKHACMNPFFLFFLFSHVPSQPPLEINYIHVTYLSLTFKYIYTVTLLNWPGGRSIRPINKFLRFFFFFCGRILVTALSSWPLIYQ